MGFNVQMNCGGGSFKSQFKKADKSGADYAIILGEEEVAQQVVAVKPLRSADEQRIVKWDELTAYLQSVIQ